jgi:acyl carrier protein
MTDHQDLVQRLLALATEHFGERAAKLTPGDDLYDALHIDSMDALGLLTRLEESFEIEIPDYEMQDVRTIASIAEIVGRRL